MVTDNNIQTYVLFKILRRQKSERFVQIFHSASLCLRAACHKHRKNFSSFYAARSSAEMGKT
ncbi:MAG TPA: hypothetical protein DCZ23_02420 [Lachnospiraceae bacterium]|nr:hypothetical protein [Lachnospiraceae bacterium]